MFRVPNYLSPTLQTQIRRFGAFRGFGWKFVVIVIITILLQIMVILVILIVIILSTIRRRIVNLNSHNLFWWILEVTGSVKVAPQKPETEIIKAKHRRFECEIRRS